MIGEIVLVTIIVTGLIRPLLESVTDESSHSASGALPEKPKLPHPTLFKGKSSSFSRTQTRSASLGEGGALHKSKSFGRCAAHHIDDNGADHKDDNGADNIDDNYADHIDDNDDLGRGRSDDAPITVSRRYLGEISVR